MARAAMQAPAAPAPARPSSKAPAVSAPARPSSKVSVAPSPAQPCSKVVSLTVSLLEPLAVVEPVEGAWFAVVSDGASRVEVLEWPSQEIHFDADPETVIQIQLFHAEDELAFMKGRGRLFAEAYIPARTALKAYEGCLFRNWLGLQRGMRWSQVDVDLARRIFETGALLAQNLLTPKVCCSIAERPSNGGILEPGAAAAEGGTGSADGDGPEARKEMQEGGLEASLRRSVAQHCSMIHHMHHQLRVLYSRRRLVCLSRPGDDAPHQDYSAELTDDQGEAEKASLRDENQKLKLALEDMRKRLAESEERCRGYQERQENWAKDSLQDRALAASTVKELQAARLSRDMRQRDLEMERERHEATRKELSRVRAEVTAGARPALPLGSAALRGDDREALTELSNVEGEEDSDLSRDSLREAELMGEKLARNQALEEAEDLRSKLRARTARVAELERELKEVRASAVLRNFCHQAVAAVPSQPAAAATPAAPDVPAAASGAASGPMSTPSVVPPPQQSPVATLVPVASAPALPSASAAAPTPSLGGSASLSSLHAPAPETPATLCRTIRIGGTSPTGSPLVHCGAGGASSSPLGATAIRRAVPYSSQSCGAPTAAAPQYALATSPHGATSVAVASGAAGLASREAAAAAGAAEAPGTPAAAAHVAISVGTAGMRVAPRSRSAEPQPGRSVRPVQLGATTRTAPVHGLGRTAAGALSPGQQYRTVHGPAGAPQGAIAAPAHGTAAAPTPLRPRGGFVAGAPAMPQPQAAHPHVAGVGVAKPSWMRGVGPMATLGRKP
eukprot:TRINITY_DN20171_c0_g1_i1.p1 TRINITY_DN20171_c0_g1~~TRINITY_DN20171_c0_g1_i1.p1  ORF type:complete len:792 (-),score=144.94 TRINITY_DN20171_c0_g1_i1:60-2435(-)